MNCYLRRLINLFYCLVLVASLMQFALAQEALRNLNAAQTQRASSLSSSPRQSGLASPESVLGFAPAADRRLASWTQITDYFQRLDKQSSRLTVETLGTTTQGRPFIVAYISSPANIRDLSSLREINHRLADPRLIHDSNEQQKLIRKGKTVVAISCSIHSTEIVASQISMQLAYELATAQDATTKRMLDDTILILIPSANPDGVDIVKNWYDKTLGTPFEGSEPPELYHPYAGHDNNRDWFMLNLKETRLVTELFWKKWFPHIVYDVHQQGPNGSRFFVPPFFDPAYPRIAPYLLREVGSLGARIAADLTAAGETGVITNAVYDMWWHGGFRTAPYYHNSIGILSEAASARLATPATVTREQLARASSRGMTSALQTAINFPEPWAGGVWRASDIKRLEISAARTVLSEAASNREHYLTNFVKLGRANIEANLAKDEPLGYLIPAAQGRDEAVARMIDLLIRQGIEVHRLTRELHTAKLADLLANPHVKPMETPLGSYLILVNQPYRANIHALFERQVYPNRKTATGETERPYDVAGWTLGLQMGVEITPLGKIEEPDFRSALQLVGNEAEVRRDLGLSLTENPDASIALAKNQFANRQSSTVFLERGKVASDAAPARFRNPLKRQPRTSTLR